MNEHEYRTLEFRNLGFRCLAATAVTLLDCTNVTVKATTYRKSFERQGDTPRQRRAFKLYTLTDSHGRIEMVEVGIGRAAWQRYFWAFTYLTFN